MGLDQYAYRLRAKPDRPVDFELDKYRVPSDDDTPPFLFYWRKHPDLQGWMENLYFSKGGKGADGLDGPRTFNCTPLLIEACDLDRLEEAVRQGTLPTTEGFFFGRSQPEDREATLEFIAKARAAIREGSYIAYDSWW